MTRALIAALLLVASGPLAAGPLAPGPRVDNLPASGPPAPNPFAATLPSSGVPSKVLPAWLAGTWVMERGADWADALWMGPRGDAMLGLTRAGFGPDVQAWDLLRIVRRSGSLVLVIQPKGGAVTEFPLAFASADAIEFANAENEFPQRIRYAREGQLLMIEVSLLDGGRAVRQNYRPVAGPPADGAMPQSP